MSHRIEQFASAMQRVLAKTIHQGLGDPRIRGMVSVTRVDVSPDLRHADVFVTVLPEDCERLTMEGLKSSELRVHTLIMPQMNSRLVPRIHFKLDAKLKKEMSVLNAIREARSRDEKDGVAQPNDKPEGMPQDPNAEDED
jgi:ribosome-binding factor A